MANYAGKSHENRSYREGDSTNQPHNQTVEVKVGEQNAQKPLIIHEKKETHIHKPFPDNRELSEKECEVETLRLNLEAQAKKDEIEYRRWVEEEYRKERRERDQYQRRQRELKEQENKKFTRRVLIWTGVACAVGLGLGAYSMYTDSRRSSAGRLFISTPQQPITPVTPVTPVNPINVEGDVK